MFRSVDGVIGRSFGVDGTGMHRIGGKWVDSQDLAEQQEAWIHSIGAVAHALPRWPLADGIDRSAFTPDPHQLAVVDKLATSWMQFVEGIHQHQRTRVVVADEGGIGKTLSVSIAVRWITLRQEATGPVLVLVPPLLTEHWGRHLRAVFSDDPDRIKVLTSARFFDSSLHREDILVISKFSWIHHMHGGRLEYPDSLCVVIDEAHQGRGGMGYSNIESAHFYEDELGEFQDHAEGSSPNQHAEVLQKTCSRASYAIAVTATPINTDMEELNYILNNIQAESATLQSGANPATPEDWYEVLGRVKQWSREAEGNEGRCPEGLVRELIRCIDERKTPPQWEMLSDEDRAAIADWLGCQLGKGSILSPSFSETLVREFHPYGRHLSMVLRSDLPHDVLASNRFRKEG